MAASQPQDLQHQVFQPARGKSVLPALAAMVYPFLLRAFHCAVSPADIDLSGIRLAGAAILLVLAFAVPLSGLPFVYWLSRAPQLSQSDLRALLLFQVASGARLAWAWSGLRNAAYRIFQIGSGAYLAAFILTHLNSALISARAVHKIDTNWSWASGAPVGLIHDAWNIRLLPHYALGVFFIIGHLSSGLRVVMLAHGTRSMVADRTWAAGLTAGAALSAAIICALCGVRI